MAPARRPRRLTRFVRSALRIVIAVTFIAVAGLWITAQSGVLFAELRYTDRTRSTSLTLTSETGAMKLTVAQVDRIALAGGPAGWNAVDHKSSAERARRGWHFAAERGQSAPTQKYWSFSHDTTGKFIPWRATVRFPYPAALAFLSLISIPGIIRRVRRVRRTGTCESCGYDLRASHGACPECGATIA